jgi:hypothetical protein
MIAKTFAFAAFLHGRGYHVDRVDIDPGNKRACFTFADAPDSEARAFRKAIDYLNALEHVARAKAGLVR